MLKSFPHAAPIDPEVYSLNIAVVLTGFPQPVVDYVTAPGTGIQTERGRRFLPTPGEVRQACENALSMFERAFEVADRPKRIEAARAQQAAERAEREQRPTYDELKARYGPNWGLKTTDDINREDRIREAKARQRAEHAERIKAAWGDEIPPTIAGVSISPELAALLEKQTGRRIAQENANDPA